MKKNVNDKILNLFQQSLKKRLGSHLKQVVLFGSRARGDNTPESDYDCLAVLDKVVPELKDSVDEITGEILYKYGAVFSVFFVSEKERKQHSYDPLMMNIHKEGIVL